ncbi:QsdR family transcriptional regulator [Amycolatopsis sp. NPDC051903]|uniref:QsdR family transcriptional regulator n=1 Tax=Amycolatopsis sp. NPDC051903 TaxID=3363936 RepID=UPI003795CDD2
MSGSPSTDDVVRAATEAYLRGESIDMSALAAELGLSRATLYRRVGNHEQLLGRVLADSTERTYRAVEAAVTGPPGLATTLVVVERFMHTVVTLTPLRQLATHDPALFAKVIMAPGEVEARATQLFTELLDRNGLRFDVPTTAVAQAVIRIGDSFMYSQLLGGEPRLDDAVRVIGLLLATAK